ncbi:MAG: OmpA family protein [Caulobacterales bacterium]|nr:OmpA family protein [Caulobacterales bacterium]
MRALRILLSPGLAGAVLLAGCASGRVTLLNDEGVTTSGAVAVLDPKTGAERGQLTAANTWTALRGAKVRAQPSAAHYDVLTSYMPAAPRHYVMYFTEGTTDLTAESVPILEALRKVVTEASDVEITGHTDTVGAAEANDKLSYERAVEIRAALVKKGLPVANARVAGRGEREPRVPTADGVDEPANRRVEVILR